MKSNKDKQMDFEDEVLESVVKSDHAYRKLLKQINFHKLVKPLENLYSKTGTPGEPIARGFKALLLQHWEDLSDRQIERYLTENLPAKLFCGYKLREKTPDHSYFGKLRKRIGLENLSKLFNKVIEQLEKLGYLGNVFHFVDASSLLSKVNVWEARDKALSDKENTEIDEETGNKKLNNKNIGKYSSDKDARFGCKSSKNFWFGYKRHNVVDMKHGMITQVSITDASIPDFKAFITEKLCPDGGMVFMDKGYDYEAVYEELEKNNCANAIIKKNNRKDKNRSLDKWRSSVRMPYENVFKIQSKIARFKGKIKVTFQAILDALVHNLKRLLNINRITPPIGQN